jgi:hypothetical protein
MTLWMLFALLLVGLAAVSMLPTRLPPPQVIVVQLPEPPPVGGSGCLPLLLLVAVIVSAVTLF